MKKELEKIKICIVGLGYVGLPLAHAFSDKYEVIGLDVDNARIEELLKGTDRKLELTDEQVQESISNGIKYTSNYDEVKESNVYIVTVPTPIDEERKPDLSNLEKSTRSIAKILAKGDLVIYESTVYPGATEDICVPILEVGSGYKFNIDFYCGYSPERINPGDKEHTVTKILKVTSGSTPETAKFVDDLYGSIITAGTHIAPSIKVAEASKLLENTQRDLNIALMNECSMIFRKLGINTHDVLAAAATKWNFINLYPGLVGGHCIGIDPYYLAYKAQEVGYEPLLILNSRRINNQMSKYIVDATIKEMIAHDVNIKKANVIIFGATFKENCPDMRNSKVIDLIMELKSFGVNVDVYDPWVDWEREESWYSHGHISDPMSKEKVYDAVVVAVAHDEFKKYTTEDYNKITTKKKIIIDIKNIVEQSTWTL
jgi:UDP-N-acetyl-D-galactosamine dehydrogenase